MYTGCIHYSINVYLSNVSLTKEDLGIYIIIYLKFNFFAEIPVLGQATDNGLISFRLRGFIVLKTNISYFLITSNISINVLTKIKLFCCSFKYSYLPWMSMWRFTTICVGPGFDSMSPSISNCANLGKLRLSPC